MKLCQNIVQTLLLLAVSNNVRFAAADDVGPSEEESVDYNDLLEAPATLWTAQIFPDAALGAPNVEAGNGAFMAPDGQHFMVTTVGATVYAYDAYSGEKKWHYQPEAVGSSIARSHSAVIFSPTEEFMVYAVVDNENSLDPSSYVIVTTKQRRSFFVVTLLTNLVVFFEIIFLLILSFFVLMILSFFLPLSLSSPFMLGNILIAFFCIMNNKQLLC